MAVHFSIPAWKIPWTKEPGGLQSIGSQRVGHDCMTNFHFLSFIADYQENPVQFLSWEDLLEKAQAAHSSIHAWRIPWTEEPDGPQCKASQRVSWTQLSD